MTKSAEPIPAKVNRDLIVAIVVGLAFTPFLILLALQLWDKPHYQFFPIVLVGFVLITRSRWYESSEGVPASGRRRLLLKRRLSSALLIISWMMLLAAPFVFSPWLAGVGAVLVAAGMLLHFAPPDRFRRFAGVWCLLWLIIPLPFQLDSRLIIWLQGVTSRLASIALDRMHIRHLMEGNILEFPERRMLVEEACSGIHSLYALVACVGLYVVWAKRSLVSSVLLIVSAVFWAGFTNALRVLTVAVAYARYDVDLATGWVHELLGVIVFVLGLLLVVSTDQFLQWIGHPVGIMRVWVTDTWNEKVRRRVRDGSEQSERSPEQMPVEPALGKSAIWNSPFAAAAFGLLCVLQLMALLPYAQARELIPQSETYESVDVGAEKLNEASLPFEQNGWKRLQFATTGRDATNYWGENSKTWTYETPVGEAVVSFDYPFDHWHDLTVCYVGHGWRIVRQRTAPLDSAEHQSGDVPFRVLEMTKPSGEHGFVIFGVLDANGDPLLPPKPETVRDRLVGRIMAGPLVRMFIEKPVAPVDLDLNTYQIQIYVQNVRALKDEDRVSMQQQFQIFARLFRQRFQQPGGAVATADSLNTELTQYRAQD